MACKGCAAQTDLLYQMLVDETAEPKALPLSLLEDITRNFSYNHEIGNGGFAVVYKGILGNRAVAVKRLSKAYMHETEFQREVQCLMRVKHKNIVRFLGYCSDTQGNMERYNGELVMADVPQRLLCFEYIPKGSLDKYIANAYREWGTCYKIIKGICEGLKYLHENHIVHLDLKPANILLSDNMVPKITDFGLSRRFDQNQSRDITKTVLGTLGYLAPELCEGGVITRSADLYSLGVIIIEILTGHKGYQATEDVLQSWSDRLGRSHRDILCEQIRVCYETALECRDINPKKRPASVKHILDRLHEMESTQISEAHSSTLGLASTEINGKSNIDDPRVFHLVPTPSRGAHLSANNKSVMRRPATSGHMVQGSAYGLLERNLPLAVKADASFKKPWPWEAHSHCEDEITKARFNTYDSPKLIYLKVSVIAAQDLILREKDRPTIAEIQMGSQIWWTGPGQPFGSANPIWNDEFMFVLASELLEDPLVVTVKHGGPGSNEPICRVIIGVASSYVPRDDLSKLVPSKWFSMSRVGNNEEVASKIQLRLSLETADHVLS